MGGETVGNRHPPPLPPPNTHPGATFFRLCAEAFLRQSFQNADSWALPSDSNEGPGNHSFKNTLRSGCWQLSHLRDTMGKQKTNRRNRQELG